MPREELYLNDIIESANAIESYLLNVKKTDFAMNDILQSAVLHKLMIIGEAASRVSIELKNKHSEVEWKEIVAFRNIVVHAYFSINIEIVWIAATIETKLLREKIKEVLKTNFPDFEFKPKT